jgi:alkylation response protein AidB-like acyl-CoA dehydrogenase
VLKVMDLKLAAMVANGEVPVYEASLLKVLSNEFRATLSGEALQIAGIEGLLRHEGTDDIGESLEREMRNSATNLFGGGSNDIQRDIIGFHGLGLPR